MEYIFYQKILVCICIVALQILRGQIQSNMLCYDIFHTTLCRNENNYYDIESSLLSFRLLHASAFVISLAT